MLLPPAPGIDSSEGNDTENTTRQKFRKKLREGALDDKDIEIEVTAPQAHMEILAPPGMEDLTSQIQGMFQNIGGGKKRTRKLKIREAMKLITDEEAGKLVNDEDLKTRALHNVEQNGIVFIDEIDKITSRAEHSGAEVSRQGVQRDLLPLAFGQRMLAAAQQYIGLDAKRGEIAHAALRRLDNLQRISPAFRERPRTGAPLPEDRCERAVDSGCD